MRDGLLQFFLGPRPSDTVHLQYLGRGDRDFHLLIPGTEYRTPIDTHETSERRESQADIYREILNSGVVVLKIVRNASILR